MYRKIKMEITNSDIRQDGIKGWVTSRLDKNDPESLLYSDEQFWEDIEFKNKKKKVEKRIEDEIEKEIVNEIEREISEVGDMEIEMEANRCA